MESTCTHTHRHEEPLEQPQRCNIKSSFVERRYTQKDGCTTPPVSCSAPFTTAASSAEVVGNRSLAEKCSETANRLAEGRKMMVRSRTETLSVPQTQHKHTHRSVHICRAQLNNNIHRLLRWQLSAHTHRHTHR